MASRSCVALHEAQACVSLWAMAWIMGCIGAIVLVTCLYQTFAYRRQLRHDERASALLEGP